MRSAALILLLLAATSAQAEVHPRDLRAGLSPVLLELKADPHAAIVKYAAYPLSAFDGSGSYIEIETEAELVSRLGLLIDDSDKSEISGSGEPFFNEEGASVAGGRVWLGPLCVDETCTKEHWRIFAINY